MEYPIISIPFKATRTSLMTNAYIDGLPSMWGIHGLVHKLELDMEQYFEDICFPKFSISYESIDKYDSNGSLSLYLNNDKSKRAARAKDGLFPSSQYRSLGEVCGCIHIYIYSDGASLGDIASRLKKHLQMSRFCSGHFDWIGSPLVSEDYEAFAKNIIKLSRGRVSFFVEDKFDLIDGKGYKELLELTSKPDHSGEYSMARAIWRLSDGLYIPSDKKIKNDILLNVITNIEEFEAKSGSKDIENLIFCLLSDELEGSQEQTCANFRNLKKNIALIKPNLNNTSIPIVARRIAKAIQQAVYRYFKEEETEEYRGYLVSIDAGYKALESFEIRDGTRLVNGQSVPHAMAEPLIGLARMRSHYSVVAGLRGSDKPNIAWEYQSPENLESGEFYLKASFLGEENGY